MNLGAKVARLQSCPTMVPKKRAETSGQAVMHLQMVDDVK